MSYKALSHTVLEYVRTTGGRMLSLDLETKVLDNAFLANETILGFSAAWRDQGTVRSQADALEEESDTAEWTLLEKLDRLLVSLRPLVLIGYYLTGYDIPLLHQKLRRKPRPFWGIEDALSRAFVLDLKDPVRFALATSDGSRPFFRAFSDVVQHSRFSGLPLMRTKRILQACERRDRGKAIYDLWIKDRERFKEYSRGDAYDALLISEELFPSQLVQGQNCAQCKKEMIWQKGNWVCPKGHLFYCPHCDGLGGPHVMESLKA